MDDDKLTTGLSGVVIAVLAGLAVGLLVEWIVRRFGVPQVVGVLLGVVAGLLTASAVYGAAL